MKIEVHMPKMGESITEGRITKWLKQPGELVELDESLLEISTDKVDTDVPSPVAGTISAHLIEEGTTVEVGAVIAYIETDPSHSNSAETRAQISQKSDATLTKITSYNRTAEAVSGNGIENANPTPNRFYSPVVMRIAQEEGITSDELERIPGSGASGRVTKSDMLSYLEQREKVPRPKLRDPEISIEQHQKAWSESPSDSARQDTSIVPMENIQRLMSEHMVRSVRTSPHVTTVSEVDMTKIVKFRELHAASFKDREGFSLTFMPFIANAAVRALLDFPIVNSSVEDTNIIYKKSINLGIAVALERGGLIVPVIRTAEAMNFTGLARAIADLAGRARNKRLQPEEILNGTFSITNYGVFGNIIGMPIINQPQVAILGMGAIKKRPIVIEQNGEDSIAIRSMMYLTLTFDHRIIDGAIGGSFLERIVKNLESFETL